jgi:cation diffusion facilitator CzcD-associated flavoprotein CzcO
MTIDAAAPSPLPAQGKPEHVDVLIVGAGISGIGSAYHLQTQCPWASYAILETHDSFGGTWLTHRYPGVRSDSDLYTFGYRFKPWSGPPIATGEQIQSYLQEVIAENAIQPHIRYRHRIDRADWSPATSRWTVEATNLDSAERVVLTTNFLWLCTGYYEHAKGYTPEWPGMSDYKGRIVHPQQWPTDLDYKGKRVLVIGSGATAATLVPAIANETAHVTLLQRSPTYFLPRRNVNDLADQLRYLEVDPAWIHEIVRRQVLRLQQDITERAKSEPEAIKAELIAGARAYLGPDFDVERHFTPRYRPWQQRIAFVPDGDLFRGIASGKASVVTDGIDHFTQKGVRLASGDEIEADIIVTATGFNLQTGGGIAFSRDHEPIDLSARVTYRGLMWEGVPNLAWIMGYFRASWTLRVDLIGDFVCRLLNHMRAGGLASVRPERPADERDLPSLPWIEEEDFNPGYLQRGAHLFPQRLDAPDWRHTQDYWAERKELPSIDFAQAPLQFAKPTTHGAE